MNRRPLDVLELPLGGTHLIEASAGTGKTYTLTSLFLRLLTETSLGIDNILAVTFTNAATAELAARVGARVAEAADALRAGQAKGGDSVVARLLERSDRALLLARLERALLDIDRVAIFTIHGFAARVLALYAFDTGLLEPRELSGDDRARSFDVVTDFWSRHVATLPVQAFAEVSKGGALFEQLVQLAKVTGGSQSLPSPAEVRSVRREVLRLSAELSEVRARLREVVRGQEDQILAALSNIPHLKQTNYRLDQIEKKVPPLLRQLALDVPLPDAEYISKAELRSKLANKAAGILHGAEHPVFELAERFTALRSEFLGLAEELRVELLHRFGSEVTSLLAREHTLLRTRSFDSLLGELLALLRRPEIGTRIAASIRRSFGVVLIDEFQDTDGVQFEIFRRLFGKGSPPGCDERLFLIGDPKQSIYAFRGADIAAYLRVASDDVPTHTLSTSYRSSPRVVRAQNLLFGGPPAPFFVEGIHYDPVLPAPGRTDELTDAAGAPLPGLELLRIPEELSAVDAAAHAVARILSSGARIGERPLWPSDIAVLTRTNAEAEEIQARLSRMGIAAVMHGDRSVFESEDAIELRRVLAGLLEPGSRAKLRAALATRLVGVTAADLASFPAEPEQLERWTERLLAVGALWRTRGITIALEELRSLTNFYARTLVEADGQRRVTNFRHLLELLHEAETREHLGRVGLFRWLESAMGSPTGHDMAVEARQVRLESDARAAVVTTMHKSKGLEYGVVVLPQVGTKNLGRGQVRFPFRFHDAGGRERIALGDDPGAPEAEDNHRVEEAEEALRLAYVGLTRARHQLVALVTPGAGSALEYFACERRPPELARAALVSAKPTRRADEVDDALESIARASEGAIEYVALTPGARAASMPSLDEPLELSEPEPLVLHSGFVRTSSFSAMTRRSEGARAEPLSRHDREGRDVDAVDAPGDRAPAQPFAFDELAREAASFDACSNETERSVLADFPRGAQAGDVLHAVFEHVPFEPELALARRNVIEAELSRARVDLAHAEAVALAVERTLVVPLSARRGGKIRLSEVASVDRKAELEFSMPVAPRAPAEGGARLSPEGVAAVLTRFARDTGPITPRYVAEVKALEFAAFSGFLRGFIDLVVFAAGALHVLDYKSNYLGEHVLDYGKGAMQLAMEHHHYLLQGLLYAVAVHRHGRRVIVDYQYHTHFGGIHYLFLRGIRDLSAPRAASEETGVYSFFPEAELIEQLSLTLDGKGAST